MNTSAGRPSIKELESKLAAYINIHRNARLAALGSILEWYERSVPTARARFAAEDEMRYQKALRVRSSGLGAGRTDEERETAYLMVIRLFERVMVRFGVDRPIDEYLTKLESRRRELEEREARVRARYAHLVNGLQSVFAPFGVKFELAPDARLPRTFDANKTIHFSVDYAEELIQALAVNGVFGVAIGEIMPLVCKALSIETDSNGKAAISASLMGENLSKLAVHTVQFVMANAAQIQKSAIPLPNVPPPDEDVKMKNIWYRGKMAKVFEFLLACEGTTHVNTIREIVPEAADITRMLGLIAEQGDKLGLWKLKKYRNGYVEFTWIGEPKKA
jgi:hypothetical protein